MEDANVLESGGARKSAQGVAGTLRQAGWQAYFVGGCVRDLLLGREAKDFDVVTNAPPGEVIELFPGANLVGAHFGVVLVGRVEVATYRSDGSYGDGRHPDRVRFETDPAKDVQRRDFTINALLMDPVTERIIDLVDGRADLERGIIRAIGHPEKRFEEDHLRMLRAIRFAARFGFEIEPATFAAIRRHADQTHRVSAERVRDELIRILVEGGARRGFELLDSTGLLHEVLPEVEAMKGVEQPPEYHPEGDVWTHTLLMLDGLKDPTPELAFGVLLHDVGKPPTFRVAPDRIRFDGHVEAGVELGRRILGRLKFPNDSIDHILALVNNHMRFMDVYRMKESTLKRFLRMPRFEDHLALHRLDCLGSNGSLDNWEFVCRKLAELPPDQLRPPRLLTGDQLKHAGYEPGPLMGKILAAVEDAQLEGVITSSEQALAFVRERFAP
jgi:putative nucleotidyltransferase with HDIG domain